MNLLLPQAGCRNEPNGCSWYDEGTHLLRRGFVHPSICRVSMHQRNGAAFAHLHPCSARSTVRTERRHRRDVRPLRNTPAAAAE